MLIGRSISSPSKSVILVAPQDIIFLMLKGPGHLGFIFPLGSKDLSQSTFRTKSPSLRFLNFTFLLNALAIIFWYPCAWYCALARGVQLNRRPDPPSQTNRIQTDNHPTRLPSGQWWVLAIPNRFRRVGWQVFPHKIRSTRPDRVYNPVLIHSILSTPIQTITSSLTLSFSVHSFAQSRLRVSRSRSLSCSTANTTVDLNI